MKIIQRFELQVVPLTINIARLIFSTITPVWWSICKILPEYSNSDFFAILFFARAELAL